MKTYVDFDVADSTARALSLQYPNVIFKVVEQGISHDFYIGEPKDISNDVVIMGVKVNFGDKVVAEYWNGISQPVNYQTTVRINFDA